MEGAAAEEEGGVKGYSNEVFVKEEHAWEGELESDERERE